MIAEICDYLKNYFDRDMPKYFGEIKIENGQLVGFSDKLTDNQYFRIEGSKFNDGVYKYPETELMDETFSKGAVWAMAIPKDFLKIVEEIETWQKEFASMDSKDGKIAMSPYQSESLSGAYSYSKGSNSISDTNKDKSGTWQGVFGARLARWRKI